MSDAIPTIGSASAGPIGGVADLGQLLSLAARGDQDAFAAVYDATSARVFGLAVRVVRDRAQAEEVAQEAFLEIWRMASRFDPSRGSALSWILMITHRKAVDRVRSAQARDDRETAYVARNGEVEHDSVSSTVEDVLEARRVRSSLESLTPLQREAIELAYLGGYSHTEVAALLNIPVGTAKTRIRDGLIRLRDALTTTTHQIAPTS